MDTKKRIWIFVNLVLVIIVIYVATDLYNSRTGAYIESLKEYESDFIESYEQGLETPEHPHNFTRASKNDLLIRELIPNHTQLWDGDKVKIRTVIVSINSDGFRDREYTIEKPKNIKRIVALGDSFTFGHGVELNESFVKILEKLLNENSKTYNYEVLNLGVPGYDLMNKIESLKQTGLKYDPDIVILQYLSDDTHYIGKMTTSLARKQLEILDNISSEYNFNVMVVDFPPALYHMSTYLKNFCEYSGWLYLGVDFGECSYEINTVHVLDGHPDSNGHLCAGEQIYELLSTKLQ